MPLWELYKLKFLTSKHAPGAGRVGAVPVYVDNPDIKHAPRADKAGSFLNRWI